MILPRLVSENEGRKEPRGKGVMAKVTLPRSERPVDQPRELRVADTWRPMRARVGRRTCEMYSKDGESETFVPPTMVRRMAGGVVETLESSSSEEGFGYGAEKRMNGRMAWKTRLTLPGLPTLISVSRARVPSRSMRFLHHGAKSGH